jgi:hypothetical protein
MIRKLSLHELAEAIESLPLNVQADLAATIQQRLTIQDHDQSNTPDEGDQQPSLRHELNQDQQETFKSFLASMPNVGEDHEFVVARDLPRITTL